jgi:hypothetical protein
MPEVWDYLCFLICAMLFVAGAHREGRKA